MKASDPEKIFDLVFSSEIEIHFLKVGHVAIDANSRQQIHGVLF